MKRLFKKALRDLFGNRTRLVIAFLAIMLGTTVFGGISFTYTMLHREINEVFSATNPASGSILVNKVDEKLMMLTKEFSGITDFEVKATHELRIEKGDGSTKSLLLFSAPKLSEIKVNKLNPLEGSFAPEPGEVLIEQDALGVAGAKPGDTITIRLPNSSVSQYHITGTVNDLSQHPPSMHNQVYAYVSAETLTDMGLTMNRIDYFASGDVYDRANILQVTSEYIHLLEQNGYQMGGVIISNTPGISMHLPEYEGALFIFQIFSVVAFIFGCVIMSSLLSTILSGQIRQIGVLKAIGAKTGKILTAYMGAALLLVVSNLAVSFVLSIFASRGLSIFFMSLGNMKMSSFSLPVFQYVLFFGASLLVPLTLAFLPIRRGLSITVKDALGDYGIQGETEKKFSVLPKRLAKKLSRPVLLSLRSAAGHKRRFLMNLSMLTLGGLIFVGIMGSIVSINTALSDNLKAQHFDYQITTGDYAGRDDVDTIMKNINTVTSYESWGMATGKLIYENGSTGSLYNIMAPAYSTDMLTPEIMSGRWLREGDVSVIVVSFEFFNLERGYALGDSIAFQFEDSVQSFTIVGMVKEIGNAGIYMNRDGFERLVPANAQKSSIKISTIDRRGSKKQLYHEIEQQFSIRGKAILSAESKAEQYNILTAHFTTTLVSFLIVAVMSICVAGFGLASTMSVQVSERTREIGIMKSMGGGIKQIKSIVTAESTFISLFSWGISSIFAIPATSLAIYVIGVYVLEIPLSLSPVSIIVSLLTWLVLTLLVGRLASRTAAKRAANISIKTALTFE